MSMIPGDFSSRIRAYESGLGPNPFQRNVPDVMPMQPRGGIAGLFERLRRPQFPPMGGFGGGRFGPPPFNPRMRGGFPGMGGGFFGGFRPRLRRRRRPRPQMPDYSKQFSSLEAKIAELQKQLAERQAATPTPDPVMDVAGPRVGTMGGPGYGEFPLGTAGPRVDPSDPGFIPPPRTGGMVPGKIQIPNIDVDAIRERIANLNIDIGGEGGRPDMPINIPPPPVNIPTPRQVATLPPKEILERGPGPARIPVKPPSIARLPKEFIEERVMPPLPQVPDVMPPMPQADQGLLNQFAASQGAQDFGLTASFDPETGQYVTDLGGLGFTGDKRFKRQTPAEFAAQLAPKPALPAPMPEPMPMPISVPQPRFMPEPMPMPMPAPVMPEPMPMPSLPKFTMPQIDPIGRVAAPLTRGPVNTAINRPAVGMRGPGPRIR